MHALLNIAVRAARKAGDIIIRNVDRVQDVAADVKGRNDFVTQVDVLAEEAIIAIIRKAYPAHAVLAEESGRHGEGDTEWIVDPLDGTTNFMHGYPQFAVSIAVRHKRRLEHGVVYDPMRQELFTASRGEGALLNDRRIRVSKRTSLVGALLGTGFPVRDTSLLDDYLLTFRALMADSAGIRRAGAAALDLAYVACGRLDGFWEFGLKEWDIAAGALLIQEAGGLVGDLEGGSEHFVTGNVAAGTPKVYKAMVQGLRLALGPNLKAGMPAS